MSTRPLDKVGKRSNQISEEHQRYTKIAPKTLVVAVICSVLLTVYIQYMELGERLPYVDVRSQPPAGALVFLFALLILGALVCRLKKRSWFEQKDLVVIYALVVFAGLLASWGLLSINIGNMAALPVLALSNASVYNPILAKISPLVTFTERQDALEFWMGRGDGSVPWGRWAIVAGMWTVFWSALFWTMTSIITLLRNYWNDRERLTYPLSIPILRMTEVRTIDDEIPFWSNRLMWLGVLISAIVPCSQLLHRYLPAIPSIPTTINLGLFFSEPPWNAVNTWPGFYFEFTPFLVGIGYLIRSEVAFSIWFFYLVYQLGLVIEQVLVYVKLGIIRYDIVRGGFMGVGLFTLWLVRGDMKKIIVFAFSNTMVKDGDEPMSYRSAFWAAVFGFLFVVGFSVFLLNMSLGTVLLFFLIFLLVTIGVGRLRAEAGIPLAAAQMDYTGINLMRAFGSDSFSTFDRLGLSMWYNPLITGYFGALFGIMMEGTKFADEVRVSKRSLTKAYFVIFLVVIVVGTIVSLLVIYDNGLFNLGEFRRYHGRLSYADLTGAGPWSEIWQGYIFGFVVAGILSILRIKFMWWPFHPLGFALAFSNQMIYYAGPIFVAWFVRTMVMRYGGPRLSQRLQPFFLGLIIGGVGGGLMHTIVVNIELLIFRVLGL